MLLAINANNTNTSFAVWDRAELKGAWHHLVLDDPPRFASLVTDWFERVNLAAAAGREHS